MSEVMCKGCAQLGTACGKCSRCYDAAQSELAALREENERLKAESFEGLYNSAIDERDALREELADVSQVNTQLAEQIASDREEHLGSAEAVGKRLTVAEQRNATISSTLEECITEMFLALEDHAVRSAMTVVGRTRFIALIKAHEASKAKPTESGASE